MVWDQRELTRNPWGTSSVHPALHTPFGQLSTITTRTHTPLSILCQQAIDYKHVFNPRRTTSHTIPERHGDEQKKTHQASNQLRTSLPDRKSIRPTTKLPRCSVTRHRAPTRCWAVVILDLITAKALSTKLRTSKRVSSCVAGLGASAVRHL